MRRGILRVLKQHLTQTAKTLVKNLLQIPAILFYVMRFHKQKSPMLLYLQQPAVNYSKNTATYLIYSSGTKKLVRIYIKWLKLTSGVP